MSSTWVVHCCTECSRMFDVPKKSRTQLCEECRLDARRKYQADWRRGRPERREDTRRRKADWRARTGRH